ncbi:MAG TPA: hypothetical protein VN962_00705 [Polyangia bacterium]|nr:hypothetical protein [Polyangia bacterium]
MRWAVAILLGAGLLGGPACHKGISATNERAGAAAPDRGVDKLRSLITLPANPSEVWFEQVPRGTPGGLGPTDSRLVAVLRFERAALARVTAAAQRRPGTPPRISAAASRPWFPDVVKGAVRPYDDHSVAVRGDKFDAAPFAKSPLLSGSFVAVEGGEYVILVLETS